MRFVSIGLLALLALATCQDSAYLPWPREIVPGTVRRYPCRRTDTVPTLDGLLDDGPWKTAPWSESFVDIEGWNKPTPRYATWFKMLWDDEYLYIGAYLEEPHLWGTYDKHDMVVFHEHDFEVFIDPDGNKESYYELEFNVIGTIFDLYLDREYRLGGAAHHEWNCEGIQGEISKFGTANNSTDTDKGWQIEIKIPFRCLRPPSTVQNDGPENIRHGDSPAIGEKWRMNFSRVEWQLEKVGDGYVKKPGTNADNWAWTPQWAVDMHQLDHWGEIVFTR
jgi:hypothetical protein